MEERAVGKRVVLPWCDQGPAIDICESESELTSRLADREAQSAFAFCKGEEQWIPPWHQEDWVMLVQAINAIFELENVWRVEEIIEETSGEVVEERQQG